MDRQNAIRILDETFNTDFDVNRYIKFIKELFNNFAINQKSWSVWKEYFDYIESYQLLGSYRDNSKKIIDVLIVKLKRTSSRDRARTMQRNFVAKYLGNAEKDGALIAFYGDDPQDWRFSFVKMEYNLVKDESGKVTVAKELTPAKRYSFLVGVNEPNHTCRSQFLNLIMEEDVNPSLSDIEQAFSIDNVTKEFFTKYKELFLELEESLQKVINKDDFVKKEFEEKNISTVDFAKKLLGQIVFIYFLQKKGWLGVSKDNDGRFKEWGTGPKDFMRRLFDKEIVPYDNFFNEILEPLFYDALATDRSADDHYYRLFKCKIPFLNGGLFEPINEYNWSGTDILLDNSIFDNILSTFDRFNFTVKEDEPLDKEVAVDPEMLGKVFENLLEVKDRKSKGAFYTPREIVHYMCQQSLINYLETNTSIERKDIERFIQLGDFALDQIIKEQEQIKKYGKSYDIKEKYTLPKSIKDNYKEIDRLLKDIKIVDPAVGSGAFLVGMMNEIVKARYILSYYLKEERKGYDLKRELIENCLYGVDIEPSAVQICKLRFWLSLIVDESDMKNIKPLPNLDHKIMCGNSLLEEFEGVKLFDEKLLGEVKKDYSFEIKQISDEIAELNKEKGEIALGKLNGNSIKEIDKEIKKLEGKKQKILSGPKESTRNLTLDEAMQKRIRESQKKLKELKQLQKKFFDEQNRKLKKQLRADIERIEWELIEETLKEQGNEEAMQKLQQYKKNKSKPFFLWKLYFSNVFIENGGFDIVIANPPYVENKKIELSEKMRHRDSFYSAYKLYDLSILFIEKSIDLLKKEGFMIFITTNKFLASDYGIRIRELLMKNVSIKQLLDVSYIRVFKESAAFPVIISYLKELNTSNKIEIYPRIDNIKLFEYGLKNGEMVYQKDFYLTTDLIFNISKNIELCVKISKLKNIKKLGDLDHKFIYRPLGFTEWGKKLNNLKDNCSQNSLKFISTPNIFKYHVNWDKKITVNKQTIKKMYMPYDDEFASSWANLTQPQILIKEIALKLTIAYTIGEYCHLTGIYGLISKDLDNKYVLALLNSKLLNFFYNSYYGLIHLTGGYLKINSSYLKNMPMKIISNNQQSQFINLVDQILSITKSDDYLDNPEKKVKVKKLEKEIDLLVYKLYELTSEEIKIVENFDVPTIRVIPDGMESR